MIPDPPCELQELMRRGTLEAEALVKEGLADMQLGRDVKISKRLAMLLNAADEECQRTGKSVQIFGEGGFVERYKPDTDDE